MSVVSVDISRKTYPRGMGGDEQVSLNGLRFSASEGEFVCLVGPSGCGKTTILNLACGLDTAFDGEILIDGRRPPTGAKVGYMFQTPRLLPWLTVRDNVDLVLADSDGNDPRTNSLLGAMGLAEFSQSYPGRLSGGMQRRVALARAFVTNPGLLLLDEPFLSLDAPVANRLRQLLLDLYGGRPATVLFVTHDLREALFLADRILFLSHRPGRVVFDLVVDLQRPREPDGPEIERLRLQLLRRHPDLLAGLVRPAEETDTSAM